MMKPDDVKNLRRNMSEAFEKAYYAAVTPGGKRVRVTIEVL